MALTLGKKLIIVMLTILGTWISQAMSRKVQEVSLAEKYEQWIDEYRQTYPDAAEKERRFQIFKANAEFVEKANNEHNRTYKLSLNKFADLTHEEFVASHTGYKITNQSRSVNISSSMYQNLAEVPTKVDWREKGAVTPIKNQRRCGCCWAFSTVASVEGITQIKTGKLISLSEQQLVDCAINGNFGCNGGWMDNAFDYIRQNQGLTTETNYPYVAMEQTCDTQKASSFAAHISGFVDVPPNNEEALLNAVAEQPVSVVLDASGRDFQFYSSGVFSGECETKLTHAVAAIGYGVTEDGTKYWLLKNSWGEYWGENGYMKLQRNIGIPEGLCGIAKKASYPVV